MDNIDKLVASTVTEVDRGGNEVIITAKNLYGKYQRFIIKAKDDHMLEIIAL